MKKVALVLNILAIVIFKAIALDKPNVLMIVLDDLNDYVGVMGGHPQAETPNIDNLAEEGVLFENAHANAAICAPSRSSFITGISPVTSQNYGFANWTKNEILINSKTLPEYARENGYKAYQTGKILHHKKNNIWNEMGVPKYHGPLAYDGEKVTGHPSVPEPFRSVGPLDGTFASLADIPSHPGYTGWWHQRKKKPFRYVSDDDRDKMTDEESVDWLRKKIKTLENEDNNQPFFIAFGIMNPHTPLVVPQKYFDMYPLETLKIPVLKEGDNDDCKYDSAVKKKGKGREHFEALKASYSELDEGLRAYLQAYLACVSFADDIVGQVVSIIDNSRFKGNTIVMLFSDHGYNMGEKDYLFKYSLWEESTRVPLIVRDPRFANNAGKTVEHPVSLIDIFPTLKDLCGWTGETLKNDRGASLDGHSLKPFLENPESGTWEGPEIALSLTASYISKSPQKQNLSARSRDYRYIHYHNGGEELYDHRKDEFEWNNLAEDPEFSEIKADLKKQLFAMLPIASESAQKTSDKTAAQRWKDKYFRWYPDADTNKDGALSWPEYKADKKMRDAKKKNNNIAE